MKIGFTHHSAVQGVSEFWLDTALGRPLPGTGTIRILSWEAVTRQ